MEWNDYWNNYQDWKYPATVILCLAVGFMAGWFAYKDKCKKMKQAEDLRIAIKNIIK